MQIFVNYKNSSYIFCWFAHDVTEARLVIKNKSVLLWDLNSISSELFKLIVYCIDHQQDRLVSLLQTKNSSLWFVHPCFALSEKSPELQQSYLWIQKLMNAMRSFLHFHFISTVHIWFISYIINTHFFHRNIWTHNWPAPNVSGFIAQLVEHRTSIARSRVQTPLKSWISVQASLRNCINCVHCYDHFFIFKHPFVQRKNFNMI